MDSWVPRVLDLLREHTGDPWRVINLAITGGQFSDIVELFWPWDWPSPDGLAGDKFHPNEKGYGYMTDIIWPKVRAALDL